MTMKRVCLPLLAIVCLLLTGCAGREVEKAYAGFSERVKTAKFTLSYTEDDSGGAVTVLAPELIAGVTARVEPGSTVLQYDGVVLDTGSLDSLGLSPMSSLPVLVQAMKSGHLDSYGEEDGLYVCRLEPNDEYRVAVWFEPDGMVPQRAELESGGRVTVIAEISGWTEGTAAAETETE